jgi:hypothetical protein
MTPTKGRGAGSAAAANDDELSLDDLAKELDTYSTAISTQLRTINLGVLGLTWLLLLRAGDVSKLAQQLPARALLGIAVTSLLALVFDLVQYLLAESAVNRAYDNAARSESRTAAYDEKWLAYRGARRCHELKLIMTLSAASVLIGVLFYALVWSAPTSA